MPPLLILLLILTVSAGSLAANLYYAGEFRMKWNELADKMNAQADQLEKVRVEVQALKDAINAADDVPQSVIDASDRVSAALQGVDDINVDV